MGTLLRLFVIAGSLYEFLSSRNFAPFLIAGVVLAASIIELGETWMKVVRFRRENKTTYVFAIQQLAIIESVESLSELSMASKHEMAERVLIEAACNYEARTNRNPAAFIDWVRNVDRNVP